MTTSEDAPAAEAADGTAETSAQADTPDVITKASIREKTWAKLKSEGVLVGSSIAVYRIPNFIGVEVAVQHFADTEEFLQAKTICINADKAQEKIQYVTVQAQKTLFIQIPLLIRRGSLKAIQTPDDLPEEQKQKLTSRVALRPFSKTVQLLNEDRKVDIIVMGSTAVSKTGYRIGKGEGFADLEYGLLLKMGLLTPSTIVATIVHDYQVYDDLPLELFREHDVGVDLIVTPTQVIRVNPKAPRSSGIIWNLLSNRRVKALPILRQLHEKEKSAGETCDLKEEDSDVESRPRRPRRYPPKPWRQRQRSDRSTGGEGECDGEDGEDQPPRPQKSRRPRQSKSVGDEDGTNSGGEGIQHRRPRRKRFPDGRSRERKETNGEEDGDFRPRRHTRTRFRHPVEFSLRVSNIASDVRVRDLKNALAECKVKPVNIKWRGQNGFALLHFARMTGQAGDGTASVDSIMTALRDLKVAAAEGEGINVEPVNAVTRIEVTDEITSV